MPEDGDGLSDVEIVAMTIRHGADYAKRQIDALARAEAFDTWDSRGEG